MSAVDEFRFVRYETSPNGRVATISLNRPKQRNAQSRGLLVELGLAFEEAQRDDAVRVVVLRAEGETFSSGHDLGSSDDRAERADGPQQHETYRSHGGSLGPGVEKLLMQEWHFFFSNTLAWRNLRKITIASCQGQVFSAGLMLAWACDLIVTDETAVFADVVATRLGMCGVEYFAHPWEFGVRRAKELLLTGDSVSAEEAYRFGMVSRVFPTGTLQERTEEYAQRIAEIPSAGSLMIKEAVNQTQDNQGFYNSLKAAFSLHELNHAHWAVASGGTSLAQTEELGGGDWRTAGPVVPARKDSVKATP
ncbi:enoyl-CoA hydratase [Pseudonocardia sp. RS010]|uniref:enoyl-CoA hydratase n=1 Tax=Pseudonocardia sp. RS010 TaxID=3385979 RepID=UPI0039A07F23